MDPWLEQLLARRKERETAARTVELLGEILILKPAVAPQVAMRYYDAKLRLIVYYAEAEKLRAEGQDVQLPAADLQDAALIDLFDDTMRSCLAEESLEAWGRLRDPNRPDPLNWEDLFSLCEGILATASGVPTGGPTDSSDGPPKNGRSSKAGSPSRAATRKH